MRIASSLDLLQKVMLNTQQRQIKLAGSLRNMVLHMAQKKLLASEGGSFHWKGLYFKTLSKIQRLFSSSLIAIPSEATGV